MGEVLSALSVRAGGSHHVAVDAVVVLAVKRFERCPSGRLGAAKPHITRICVAGGNTPAPVHGRRPAETSMMQADTDIPLRARYTTRLPSAASRRIIRVSTRR